MTTLDPTSPEHLRALLTHVLTDPEAFAVLAQGQPVWEGAAGITCKGCGRNTVSLARTWKLVDHACEACGHRWIAWENAEAEAQYAAGITAVQETDLMAPLTTRKLVGFTRLAPTTTHTPIAEKPDALLAAGHTLDGDLAGPFPGGLRVNGILRPKTSLPSEPETVTYLKADTTYMVKATATPSLDRDVDAQWTIIVDVLKKEYGYLVVTDELQKKMAASIVVALTGSTLVDVTKRAYPLMPRLSKRYAVDGIPRGTLDHYAGQESSAADEPRTQLLGQVGDQNVWCNRDTRALTSVECITRDNNALRFVWTLDKVRTLAWSVRVGTLATEPDGDVLLARGILKLLGEDTPGD